jgi:chromosome segregation ATPase
VLLVVHAELGVVLGEAMSEFFESMKEIARVLGDLHGEKRAHQREMLEASSELVSMSRVRRQEQASVQLLQDHAISTSMMCMVSFREELQCIAAALQSTLLEAVSAEAHARREARSALDDRAIADSEVEELRSDVSDKVAQAEAAQARATELASKFQRAAAQLAQTEEERLLLSKQSSECRAQLEEETLARETATQLLAAEKQAHQLARSHEEALERDVAELSVKLERLEGSMHQAEADLLREKDAHRSTIRSMSQR